MLAQAAVSHVFAPSETVIRAGDPGSSMFVVHKGRVRVQVSENGRSRTVATLNEGDFFGEMALFTGEPRTANVLALEETEVLEIGHAAMKRVFDTNPDLVESLSFIMAERRQGLASQTDSPATTSDSSPAFSPQSSASSVSINSHKQCTKLTKCASLCYVIFLDLTDTHSTFIMPLTLSYV